MNLPIFNPLLIDQSTYITFSRALLDLDYAHVNSTEYFYSKLVALKLPDYKNPDFYINPSIIPETVPNNPNATVPKGMQYYMENIIRQSIDNPNITELALYKFLNWCGLSYSDIEDSIVFVNNIMTSNFTYIDNNSGWCEIVGQVPNNSGKLNLSMKTTIIDDIIGANDTSGDAIYDNGDMEFDFTDCKKVIDFENTTVTAEDGEFDFNVLLVFYRDKDGIDKLHGINFITPYANKVTHFETVTYTQKTNDARSIGYQFKFNLKTVNNEATQILIHAWNDHPAWNLFSETLEVLNTFLKIKILEDGDGKLLGL